MAIKRFICAASTVAATTMLFAGCGTTDEQEPSSQKQAEQKAQTRQNYAPQNDVEGANYNARQRMADDPTTIIWCSVYPSNPNVKSFTVPIAGKLTSGNKRPYATSREASGGSDGVINEDFYTTEVPGPDGFYGTSGEYRYGFDPAGNYYDFYNVETLCTSVPTLVQRQTTEIAVTVKGNLSQMDQQAQEALKVCRTENSDPSAPCPGAAQILGVN